MWYDKLGIISIGVVNGGPEDGGLGDIKVDLWRLFIQHCHSTYCPSIAHYALVIKIDGEILQFGAESIQKIRFSKRDRFIGADISVPEIVWRDMTRNEWRDYLASRVRETLQMCVARLLKDKQPVDEPLLFGEIDVAIQKFAKIDYDRDA